jgi:hypothetical protein
MVEQMITIGKEYSGKLENTRNGLLGHGITRVIVPMKMIATMALGLFLIFSFWKVSFFLIYGGMVLAISLSMMTVLKTDLAGICCETWIPKRISRGDILGRQPNGGGGK